MNKSRAREIESEKVLEAIFKHCQGRENALSGPGLVELVTGKPSSAGAVRELRRVVTALRQHGWPICGRPRDGYFWATNTQELEDTRLFLHKRAMCSLRVAAWIKNRAMPAVAGQLSLPVGEQGVPVLPEAVTGGVEPLAVELPTDCWESVQDWLKNHPGYNPNKLINDALIEFLKFRGGM